MTPVPAEAGESISTVTESKPYFVTLRGTEAGNPAFCAWAELPFAGKSGMVDTAAPYGGGVVSSAARTLV